MWTFQVSVGHLCCLFLINYFWGMVLPQASLEPQTLILFISSDRSEWMSGFILEWIRMMGLAGGRCHWNNVARTLSCPGPFLYWSIPASCSVRSEVQSLPHAPRASMFCPNIWTMELNSILLLSCLYQALLTTIMQNVTNTFHVTFTNYITTLYHIKNYNCQCTNLFFYIKRNTFYRAS